VANVKVYDHYFRCLAPLLQNLAVFPLHLMSDLDGGFALWWGEGGGSYLPPWNLTIKAPPLAKANSAKTKMKHSPKLLKEHPPR